jgi:predicted secreted protein
MSEIVITQDDQGRTIEAQQGDTIVFHLEENLATGYGWELDSVEGFAVELTDSTYNQSPGTLMGRGGMRVLRFIAKEPGSQEIHLRLHRSWDPPEKVLKEFNVKIHVR